MDSLMAANPHDLLLTDTSLAQSLIAARQSARGSVVQVDPEAYYGGPEGGSHCITVELNQTRDQSLNSDTSTRNVDKTPSCALSFTFDPSPVVFYARGPLADALLQLELTEYLEFVAVERVVLWPSRQQVMQLPLSKEHVMLEPGLTLLEKRQLARLLTAILALSPDTVSLPLHDLLTRQMIDSASRVFWLVAYGICRCASLAAVRTLRVCDAMQAVSTLRLSTDHLSRPSPFVVPVWGASELAQAACRKAAVQGCVHLLRPETDMGPERLTIDPELCRVRVGEEVKLIGKQMLVRETAEGASHVPEREPRIDSPADIPRMLHRQTLLLDRPILGDPTNCLFTIPPGSDLNPSLDSPVINLLQLNADTKCVPAGKFIVHVWSTGQLQSDAIDKIVLDGMTDGDDLHMHHQAHVLWSRSWSISTPVYHLVAMDGAARVPYQPTIPACFSAEAAFVSQLEAVNKQIG